MLKDQRSKIQFFLIQIHTFRILCVTVFTGKNEDIKGVSGTGAATIYVSDCD